MLTPDELNRLKNRLPRGYFNKAIEKSKMSEKSVANFFSGKIYNLTIHQAALEVAEEYENELNAVMKRSKITSDEK